MSIYKVVVRNDLTINDLLRAHTAGIPVTMTSHPGNASLYKLALWSVGIPEMLWDITTVKADANNQPAFRLISGKKELLLSEGAYEEIMVRECVERRYVTAYQKTKTGAYLGAYHVSVMKEIFGSTISSQSEFLLKHKERVHAVFDYLGRSFPEEYFTRHIDGKGIVSRVTYEGGRGSVHTDEGMLPMKYSLIADSAMNVLSELKTLLFAEGTTSEKGGISYSGALVQMIAYLASYWETGSKERYDISGPDMIRYASKKNFQDDMTLLLYRLRCAFPDLVPSSIVSYMCDGTYMRNGHVEGHLSSEFSAKKLLLLREQKMRREKVGTEMMKDEAFSALKERLLFLEKGWPLSISPAKDAYFSQHDLKALGTVLVLSEEDKDMSFEMHKARDMKVRNVLKIV